MSRGTGLLEASDLNDDAIMTKTRAFQKGGLLQFRFEGEDGQKITSEWFHPDDKQKAIMRWLEVIKEQVVAHANAKVEETKARIRREKAEQNAEAEAANAQALGLIVPAGTVPYQPAAGGRDAPPVMDAAMTTASSAAAYGIPSNPAARALTPIALAQQQLALAQANLEQKTAEYHQARHLVMQWDAMLKAMQALELPQQPGVIQVTKSLRDGEV